MNGLNNINTAIASLNSNDFLRVILYRDESLNKETNCKILTASIKFIKDANVLKNVSFNVYKSSLNHCSWWVILLSVDKLL